MSVSNDSTILSSLQAAKNGKEVRILLEQYGQKECDVAWRQLSPLERTALQFANEFKGEIIHDYKEQSQGSTQPISDAQ